MARLLPLLPVLALLGACQPLPQPFQADSRAKATSPLVRPTGETSLFVAPVAGLPAPADSLLAEALASALAAKEVPASARSRSRLSSVLNVTVEPRGGDLLWRWSERRPDGGEDSGPPQPLGIAAGAVAAGDPASLKQAATAIAAGLATRLALGPNPASALDTAPAKLAVRECEGAPGDGNRSLRQAMREILILANLPPQPDPATADFVIGCMVRVWADGPEAERITIDWVLTGPGGAQLGEVKQANRIPRGQLAGPWGGTAHIIAQGGWQGLSQILESRRRPGPALPPPKS